MAPLGIANPFDVRHHDEFFRSQRAGVTFQRLRAEVSGYFGATGSDASVARMFERDKDELRAIGVQFAQGYYFGKPSPEPNLPWDFAQQQMRFAKS